MTDAFDDKSFGAWSAPRAPRSKGPFRTSPAYDVECPTCEAKPGEKCTMVRFGSTTCRYDDRGPGAVASSLHPARLRKARGK